MDFRYLINLCEAAYDSKIAAMLKKYPDYADDINWAKNLKKQDRVVWYLNVLEKYLNLVYGKNPEPFEVLYYSTLKAFQDDLLHYLGQENIATIQNYRFTTQKADQVFTDLARLEREFVVKTQQNTQPSGRYDARQGDQELLKFNDGTRWVKLNTAYCQREGASGAHCGNVEGQFKSDQRILSLRNKDNQVILTFILEPDNTLGEMKARFNRKPDARYHPQIMQLLMQDYIKGIKGGGYQPGQNFSVLDLNDSDLEIIHRNKPQLIATQLVATPDEILRAPEWVRKDPTYRSVVIKKYPEITKLIDKPSIPNWEQAINSDRKYLIYAPDTLFDYRNRLLRTCISQNTNLADILKIRPKYLKDFEFLKKLVEYRPEAIRLVSTNQRGYEELAKIAIKEGGPTFLQAIPEKSRTPELCMLAVKQSGVALQYVPMSLRTFEMCVAAMASSGMGAPIHQIPENFLTPKFWEEVVKQNGDSLASVPEKLATPELCLLAIKNSPGAFYYVPQKLKEDLKFLQSAVEAQGILIEQIPKIFRTVDTIKKAMETWKNAFTLLPPDLKKPDISLKAVKLDGILLQSVPYKSQTFKVCQAAVNNNGFAIQYIDKPDFTRRLAVTAVSNNGLALSKVPDDMRTLEVCKAAVENNGLALQSVPVFFRTSKLCMEAVSKEGFALSYVPLELRTEDLCLVAVKNDGTMLSEVPEQQRTEKVCLAAIEQNTAAYRYVPKELLDDKEFLLKAIGKNKILYDEIHTRLNLLDMYQLVKDRYSDVTESLHRIKHLARIKL